MCSFVILLLSNEMQMSVRRFSAIPHLGEDTLVEEDFDDCPSNYDSDGTDMVPKLSSVRDSPASPEVMQQTNLLSLLK